MLSVATYNMHGFRQGYDCLVNLCMNCDIVFVQEHWLAPFDLCYLDQVCQDMICYSSSALTDSISKGCLRGRPFGGVAIFVKNTLTKDVKLVKADSRYIILLFNGSLLINVYLPCASTQCRDDVYMDCLACIMNDISDIGYSNIIFGGDMNVDFIDKNLQVYSNLMSFVRDINLTFVDELCDGPYITFRVHTTGAESAIDHFAVSQSLYDRVTEIKVIDSGINLSDHCSVVMYLSLPGNKVPSDNPTCNRTASQNNNNNGNHQLSFRWDKGDISQYYNVTRNMLHDIQVPTFLLTEAPVDHVTAMNSINNYYLDIVNSLYNASVACIPRKSQGFFKYWWDKELTLLKEKAVDSFRLWSSLGKPRSGSFFDEMTRDKLRYKLSIKTKQNASANEFSNSLNDALLSKDMESFWRTWRSKFTKTQLPSVIDGCHDEKDIADKFASVFQSVCVPNNAARHAELCEEFFQLYSEYHISPNIAVSVETVDKCIYGLNKGKAAGFDGLTVEHVIHSHPALVVHLTVLFNILLSYGVVPNAFGQGIIIPLIKNVEGDKTKSDNYRGITLSPVLSKLFESVLMVLFGKQLCSDKLQFGFKSQSSCNHDIFTPRTVIEHYTRNGSTVTVCALDISKAFDRVDHFALLRLLIKRQLPRNFISVLLDWFSKCYACVRWAGAYSYFFHIISGVRQGGLLSPVLFAIYMDILIDRLRSCGFGCRLLDDFYGCLLYADDIVLLSHSLNAMRIMLDICDKFAIEFDIKFNGSKSVVMRTGPRFDVACAPLSLSGCDLKYVTSVKYLGVCLVAGKYFRCNVEHVKMKFYRVFNAIYAKSKGANSELVTVELMKSYCLPFIMYATESVSLSRSAVNMLDSCINTALYKIFHVDHKHLLLLRQYLNVPSLKCNIEKRKDKFMNSLLTLPDFKPVLRVYGQGICCEVR